MGRAEIVIGDVRISMLSDSLVRIEDRGPKGFEDRPSYLVLCREAAEIPFNLKEREGETAIETDAFSVRVPANGTAKDVYITAGDLLLYRFEGETGENVYLPSPSDELKSWYFTDSARTIPSSRGYGGGGNLPLAGWDFGNRATDIFVFLPRGDYRRLCRDFVLLTGKTELVELATLGVWDSRWYPYSEESALKQIKDYRDRGYPLDVLVIDVDWKAGNSLGGDGIGYAINETLFPDMARFLRTCRKLGVRVCFNDHPEPKRGTTNGLDEAEIVYRSENLTRLLEMGLDYWWYDRNWHTSLHSFDPDVSVYAFGMYAFHFIEKTYFERAAEPGRFPRRAVIMGNVDGCLHGKWKYASDLTAHRYAIQWTGDIGTDSAALLQEIRTAVFGGAEGGLPYVSSDIGGHTQPVTDDMYIRWIEYGALSAVLRVHCTNAAYIGQEGRMPWLFGEKAERVAHTYMDMRCRLLPLFYALAHENRESGLPILRRLDIDYPRYAESQRDDEYLLGEGVLIAPLWDAPDPEKGYHESCRDVFLPDGVWIDAWTGKREAGPAVIRVRHPLETSPIFVREGSLVVLAEPAPRTQDWSRLVLDVYPSADFSAHALLYEDDRETLAYRDGNFRTTELDMRFDGENNTLILHIGEAKGTFDGGACLRRLWKIRVHKNPEWHILSVRADGAEVPFSSVAQSRSAPPFACSGGAADGEIAELSFEGDVNTAHTVEIAYSSVKRGEQNADYDRTALNFTLRSEEAELPLGLEECDPGEGPKKVMTIETDGEADYILYAGGMSCTARLSVRDRGGHVRTETFGNLKGDFFRRAAIHVNGPESTLYITYTMSACEHDGTDSPSRLRLYRRGRTRYTDSLR